MQQQNLLQRAQAGLPLVPSERAIVKALQTIAPTVLVAVLSVLSGALVGSEPMNLGTLLSNCGTAAIVTALWATRKYLSAIQEPVAVAVGAAAGTVGDAVAKQTGYQAPSDVKQLITPAPAPIETPTPDPAPAV